MSIGAAAATETILHHGAQPTVVDGMLEWMRDRHRATKLHQEECHRQWVTSPRSSYLARQGASSAARTSTPRGVSSTSAAPHSPPSSSPASRNQSSPQQQHAVGGGGGASHSPAEVKLLVQFENEGLIEKTRLLRAELERREASVAALQAERVALQRLIRQADVALSQQEHTHAAEVAALKNIIVQGGVPGGVPSSSFSSSSSSSSSSPSPSTTISDAEENTTEKKKKRWWEAKPFTTEERSILCEIRDRRRLASTDDTAHHPVVTSSLVPPPSVGEYDHDIEVVVVD